MDTARDAAETFVYERRQCPIFSAFFNWPPTTVGNCSPTMGTTRALVSTHTALVLLFKNVDVASLYCVCASHCMGQVDAATHANTPRC